jgi:hypothetical protein
MALGRAFGHLSIRDFDWRSSLCFLDGACERGSYVAYDTTTIASEQESSELYNLSFRGP